MRASSKARVPAGSEARRFLQPKTERSWRDRASGWVETSPDSKSRRKSGTMRTPIPHSPATRPRRAILRYFSREILRSTLPPQCLAPPRNFWGRETASSPARRGNDTLHELTDASRGGSKIISCQNQDDNLASILLSWN